MRDPNLFRWIVLAGSFSCERIWYNFDRWPCQGEGLVYSRLVANDCITSLIVCGNVKRYAMFVSAFFSDLDIDGRKADEAIFPTSFIVLIGSCAYWPVLIKRLLTVLWISSACFEHSPSKYKSAWICGVTLASMSSSKLIPAELALPQASLFFVLPQSGLTLIVESCIQVILNHAHCHIAIQCYTYPSSLDPFPSFQEFPSAETQWTWKINMFLLKKSTTFQLHSDFWFSPWALILTEIVTRCVSGWMGRQGRITRTGWVLVDTPGGLAESTCWNL